MSVKKLSWVTSELEALINYYLTTNREIPDYLGYYSPLIVEGLDNINQSKLIPRSNSNLLHIEKQMLEGEALTICNRLSTLDSVNIVCISEVSIESSAPLITEFAKTNLTHYTSVSCNALLNKYNKEQVEQLLVDINSTTKISTQSITIEPELQSFGDFFDNDVPRVFLLSSSRLGNSPAPSTLLKNIRNSMRAIDFLVIVQGLKKDGVEPLLLADYQLLLSDQIYAKNDTEIAASITPNINLSVSWFSDYYEGISLNQTIDQDVEYCGVPLLKGEKISLFKSIRFSMPEMFELLTQSLLTPLQISLDETNNFGLFVVKRS